MLSLGGFPPPCNTTHTIRAISQFLPFPTSQLPFLSNGLTYYKFYPYLGQLRSNFCASARKSRREEGNRHSDVEGFDYDDDGEIEIEDGGEDEDEGEGEGEGEGDEVFVPLAAHMKDWLRNKPSGFGKGKVYDTSVEDKLFEEMEQSKKAQLANINKLKNSPPKPTVKKGVLQKPSDSEVVPSGNRVRMVNLPKKKNIHRDLQLAFKGVPGVVNIVPAVSGNKKTRDPICKGFAFIDLKSKEDANRFVQIFSRQSISFGKIQKQITCDIVNSESPSSDHEQATNKSYSAHHLALPRLPEVPDAVFDTNYTYSDLKDVSSNESEGAVAEHVPAQCEHVSENLRSFSLSEHSVGMGPRTVSDSDILSSNLQDKVREDEKKPKDRRKRATVQKLNVPGSANRLKIREKAVLTGVLSKYALLAASASKDQS